MTLSTLVIVLGLLCAVPALVALANPELFARFARQFPRSVGWGYFFMAIGTLWFLRNLDEESISDFAAYKGLMMVGFGSIGLLTCIFVQDYLAARGLAVVLLLVAKLMLDTARWHESQWRWVISLWAYAWIIAGMWLTVSPWRLRDLLHWATANPKRLKAVSTARLAFCAFVILLGATVLKHHG